MLGLSPGFSDILAVKFIYQACKGNLDDLPNVTKYQSDKSDQTDKKSQRLPKLVFLVYVLMKQHEFAIAKCVDKITSEFNQQKKLGKDSNFCLEYDILGMLLY